MASNEALINNASRKWRKYTALNLLPLYTQGTIEFRHMPGTCDLNFILQWCEIISSMFKYARNHEFKDVVAMLLDLNTSSAYATFMQNIFQGNLYDVLAVGPFREYLEEGVINMKVMLNGYSDKEEEKTFQIHDNVAAEWAPMPVGEGWGLPPQAVQAQPQVPIGEYSLVEINAISIYNRQRAQIGFRRMSNEEELRYVADMRQRGGVAPVQRAAVRAAGNPFNNLLNNPRRG
jgi:hypothetical protein